MAGDDLDDLNATGHEAVPDAKEAEAAAKLEQLFEKNKQAVYFSRQLEVIHEEQWFHWITNRALGQLEESGLIRREERTLATGGKIIVL